MIAPYLLHHLVDRSAAAAPDAPALSHQRQSVTYAGLATLQRQFATGLAAAGVQRGDRVGIFLSKCPEAVVAAFGCGLAGACFVPMNPVLKPPQLAHIARDCALRVLVTSPERLALLKPWLAHCTDLELIVLVGGAPDEASETATPRTTGWADLLRGGAGLPSAPLRDSDLAAILYTSGSTGYPKGVVLNHRNLVSGAASVASYLGQHREDRLLCVLPLSFDAGFSQLTTAFTVGASAVLLEYLAPHDVVRALASERITGVTAVPPLWIRVANVEWPQGASEHLRYFANTGGKMPRETLSRLRARAPRAQPFLMYGLTEAFRSTYLPPAEVDRRPDSIGKAIPNQEILVLRPDGTRCDPNEPGELVHRGSTVAMGYWGDPQRTAERFRPLAQDAAGVVLPELAVFSGDTVSMDEEGFLYFVGRRDEMIKSSGYRISPVEVEDAVYGTGLAAEVAAFGIPHDVLGQAVALVVQPSDAGGFDAQALLVSLRGALPHYMVPQAIHVSADSLPRNGNGKIDRAALVQQYVRQAPVSAGAVTL